MDNEKIYVIFLFGIMLGMIIYHVLVSNQCEYQCTQYIIDNQCICIHEEGYMRFKQTLINLIKK